jgi:ribose transport system substrate-binding protein
MFATNARRVGRGLIGAVAATCAVTAIAACGGSQSTTSSGSAAAASSSGDTAGLAAAKAEAIKAQARPTQIEVSSPVGKPIPSGKKVVFISCGVPACAEMAPMTAAAAKILGWSSSSINTDGSPAQIQGAYDTAIRQGANAIVTNSASRAELGAQIPQLLAKHIAVSQASSTDAQTAPFIYNTSTAQENAPIGKDLAAEIVADSNGKANVLWVGLPFPILGPLSDTFKSDLQNYCPKCGYSAINIGLTQIPQSSNTIVAYLRSHPSVNYVALSVGGTLDNGLPTALAAAGLSNVKIVSQGAGPTEFQDMAQGKWLAAVPYDDYDSTYQEVDALARHFAGVPVQSTGLPVWLVTKNNLPSSYSSPFPNVESYSSQFAKLWGK